MTSVQYQKVTQSLNYLLQLSKDKKMNKLHLIKLLWAADRYHMRKYGRLVSEDTYVAMPKGPVASLALHIINDETDFIPTESVDYGRKYIKLGRDKLQVSSLEETNSDFLSQSDIESLDFAWDKFNDYDRFDLVEFTHRYPEWKKHESVLEQLKTSMSIDPLDFFEDPSDGMEDPFKQDAELIKANRETYSGSRALKSIFQ